MIYICVIQVMDRNLGVVVITIVLCVDRQLYFTFSNYHASILLISLVSDLCCVTALN